MYYRQCKYHVLTFITLLLGLNIDSVHRIKLTLSFKIVDCMLIYVFNNFWLFACRIASGCNQWSVLKI